MRLINIHTRQLEEFLGANIPPYYILSHTWESDEISFQDYMWLLNYETEVEEGIIDELMPRQRARIQAKAKSLQDRSGYHKINSFIEAVRGFPRREGKLEARSFSEWDPEGFRNAEPTSTDRSRATDVDYVWIDTCCINKESSAELSEAINSMYMWYGNSRVCIVFLPDIDRTNADPEGGFIFQTRWFTRGWTLQELLAPRILLFYDKQWQYITSRIRAKPRIEARTGMSWSRSGGPRMDVSISKRMSWAANRETTRVEDRAYSLMGIFGVNMPLLYGEGEQAFLRLQREIASVSADLSIFAWGYGMPTTTNLAHPSFGMFAQSPAAFSSGGCLEIDAKSSVPYTSNKIGVEMFTTLVRPVVRAGGSCNTLLILDDVSIPKDTLSGHVLAIPVSGVAINGTRFKDAMDGSIVFRAFGHPVPLPKRILKERVHKVRRRVVVRAEPPLGNPFSNDPGSEDYTVLSLTVYGSIKFEIYECWPNGLKEDRTNYEFEWRFGSGTDTVILRFAGEANQSARGQYALVLYLSDGSRAEGFYSQSALVYRWEDFAKHGHSGDLSARSIAGLLCDDPDRARSARSRSSEQATTRYGAKIEQIKHGPRQFLVYLF